MAQDQINGHNRKEGAGVGPSTEKRRQGRVRAVRLRSAGAKTMRHGLGRSSLCCKQFVDWGGFNGNQGGRRQAGRLLPMVAQYL